MGQFQCSSTVSVQRTIRYRCALRSRREVPPQEAEQRRRRKLGSQEDRELLRRGGVNQYAARISLIPSPKIQTGLCTYPVYFNRSHQISCVNVQLVVFGGLLLIWFKRSREYTPGGEEQHGRGYETSSSTGTVNSPIKQLWLDSPSAHQAAGTTAWRSGPPSTFV